MCIPVKKSNMYILFMCVCVCVCHCWCKSVLITMFSLKCVQIHSLALNGDQAASAKHLGCFLGRMQYFCLPNCAQTRASTSNPQPLWNCEMDCSKNCPFCARMNQSKPFNTIQTKMKLPLLQHLANSPLKPRLDRRTSLVNSEPKRTIYVISSFGIICFVLSIMSRTISSDQTATLSPQQWMKPIFHLSIYLAIHFCASTCVWTCN